MERSSKYVRFFCIYLYPIFPFNCYGSNYWKWLFSLDRKQLSNFGISKPTASSWYALHFNIQWPSSKLLRKSHQVSLSGKKKEEKLKPPLSYCCFFIRKEFALCFSHLFVSLLYASESQVTIISSFWKRIVNKRANSPRIGHKFSRLRGEILNPKSVVF